MKQRFFVIIALLSFLFAHKVQSQEAEIPPQLKRETLASISQTTGNQAYVYGVDFTRRKTAAAGFQTALYGNDIKHNGQR